MATATPVKKPDMQEPASSHEVSAQANPDGPFFLSRMRDEFDRLLHRFSRNWPALWEMDGSSWRWGVEMKEKEDALIVEAEAPGFEPGDFDIRVEDHRLVLRATRKSEVKGKDRSSVSTQEFYQSVTLPTEIEKEKVEADYHNGVITVTMPKAAKVMARKVEVHAK